MSSYNTIINELITQKQLLEEKGFSVSLANTNPSPTEITTAISNINIDFSQSTATEADVRAGKTFYSQTSDLKTGTLDASDIDKYKNLYYILITGQGSMEIDIPSDINEINSHAFQLDHVYHEPDLYYKQNMVIPPNIQKIGVCAFKGAKITGPLTIPPTVTLIGTEAFRNCQISALTINGGLDNRAASSYAFSYNVYLKDIIVNQQVPLMPDYVFQYCAGLLRLTLPPTLEKFANHIVYDCRILNTITFTGETPPAFNPNCFGFCPSNSIKAVPYLSFDAYLNATNFISSNTRQCGFGEFFEGETLPTSIEGYTMVWYASVVDFKYSENPITVCPATGKCYAEMIAVE